MSFGPMVSCVLATGDRPEFLRQALRCYRQQRYALRELVVVDDGAQATASELVLDPEIRYLRLPRRTALGEKLNLAIEQARGDVIQKLDDDDYYAPDFLERMLLGLGKKHPDPAVAALDCFLVLIASSGHLTFSGHGWLAGNSLCFQRALWERRAFRPVERAEDWWFLRDHATAHVRVCDPELAIVVRHELGHTWTHCGKEAVTERFRRSPPHQRALSALVSGEALEFYQSMRGRRPEAHARGAE